MASPANPFLSKIPFVHSSALLNRIETPFLFFNHFDRLLGFVNWDFTTGATHFKLLLIIFVYTYFLASIISMLFVDLPQESFDSVFGMLFLIGTGAACLALWHCLAFHRRDLRKIICFLSHLQTEDVNNPLRVRSRPTIAIFCVVYWMQNLAQGVFWAVNLMPTSSLAKVISWSSGKLLVFALYLVEVVLLEQMACCSQVLTFSALLVFTTEFTILGADFQQAYDCWDFNAIRSCIQRHQKLLEMVMLLRDKMKLYFLVIMQVHFFIITYSCFLLVVGLKHSGTLPVDSSINLVSGLITLSLNGWFCDMLNYEVEYNQRNR